MAYLDFWPSKKKKFQSLASPAQPVAIKLHQSTPQTTPGTRGHQRPAGAGCLGDPARRRRPAGTLLGILAALVLQRNAPPRCRYVPPRVPLPTMPPDLSSQIPRPNPNRRPWRLAASMRDAAPPCRQDVAAPSLQVGASPPSAPAALQLQAGAPAALLPAVG